MPWQLSVCFPLVLSLYLQRVSGCTNAKFERFNFTYTANEVIENVTARSRLQCTQRSTDHDWGFAIEFQEDSSTCVILKSAAITAGMTNVNQYRRIYTSCHEGWTRFNDACYYVTPDAHNWNDCKDICAGYGNSHLVSDTSAAESTFIKLLKDGNSIWTGGMLITLRDPNDGKWDNGEPWGYTYFSTSQPNNAWGSEYCIHYYTTNNWGDMPCDQLHHCMCEKELF